MAHLKLDRIRVSFKWAHGKGSAKDANPSS